MENIISEIRGIVCYERTSPPEDMKNLVPSNSLCVDGQSFFLLLIGILKRSIYT
jgi:hypothetical protein